MACVEAQAAVDPPNQGEQRQLNIIAALLELGADKLADGEYADAIGIFLEALQRARNLM